MDHPVLPPTPSILPSIPLKPKSNLPKILLILIPLLAVAIFTGFTFIKQPFNFLQPKKTIPIPIRNQVNFPSSEGFRTDPKYNTIGFNGKVKEKGVGYLILMGAGETIKVEISNEVKIRLINQAEFSQNPELYLAKPPEFIQFSDIETGNDVSVLGKGDLKLIKTLSITVFK